MYFRYLSDDDGLLLSSPLNNVNCELSHSLFEFVKNHVLNCFQVGSTLLLWMDNLLFENFCNVNLRFWKGMNWIKIFCSSLINCNWVRASSAAICMSSTACGGGNHATTGLF